MSADLEHLADAVAAIVAVPRAEPPDSFVLHAPLELLARRRILDRVAPDRRRESAVHVAHHLRAIADGWQAFSGPVPPSDRPDVRGATVEQLAPTLALRTAAAAHAPILLASLRAEGEQAARWMPMLAPLQLALDLHPGWRIGWVERVPPIGGGTPSDLGKLLASPPALGRGESTWIHPMIQRAEDTAAALLAPVVPAIAVTLSDADLAAWASALLRVAAASMLLDAPEHAPYGWSHCLTMPLAVLQLADEIGRGVAVAVAATHVLAFRCGLSDVSISPSEVADLVGPLTPDTFASEAAALAEVACRRHDAHLVKYSLAVIEAAELDPPAAALYLAAGRRLQSWWDDHGGDPLDT